MPFDAIFLSAVAAELRPALLGARVDKLQQPSRDTVLLQFRGRERLLLSANVNRPRIHLTRAAFENPAQPPMFCMLLRKHLTGARLTAIEQPQAERVIRLLFDCTDELGTPCTRQLVLELMGRNSNLILVGADGRILDCLRRVDFEMSQLRQVLPGLFYHDPPRQEKCDPKLETLSGIESKLSEIDAPRRLDKWLLDTYAGLSPLIARELAFCLTGETDSDLLRLERSPLAPRLVQALNALGDTPTPTLLLREGKPTDYSYRCITQYGDYYECCTCEQFSALLDRFYTQTDHEDRMRQKSQTIRKTITNLYERTQRKLALQRRELEATHSREQLRRCGDIITANLHRMERGQRSLRAVNFYDPDMAEVEIPLRPELSPQQNAARYYKDYNRAKHAEAILTQQIAQGETEADYLATVLDELSRAENEQELGEIRAELEAGGYVRPGDRRKQRRLPPSTPMVFYSSDGFRILVGRNNRQNDQLSLKTAHFNDIWLHVQKFHGTHVVIDCGGSTPPDRTITEAAMLAVWFSQARESQNVPVDVTQVRNLRKPNGAKPGMVVYERYRTVLVTPDATLAARLSAPQN